MDASAPFAPLVMVIGALWLFGKIWPSRLGIVVTAGLAAFSYIRWRIMDTVPWTGGFGELWWPATCLVIEVAAMFDACILFALLSRPTDRSAQADAGEARLRALWARDEHGLPQVDVFIATYNEPKEVLEKTILGCLALEWPNARVWVLDDGRRVWVRDLCIEKGAGYINRPNNKGAKAGNINHAIEQTDAPFVAVFDADFVPQHDFLLRTMGFFDDEKVGIVQIPHSFYNHDPMQTNLGMEQAMPDDQRFFFEAIMPGRDGWDAAFCCGSNSVTRRKLFEEIGGGLPEGSITEDMLLTLASLRNGYVTRYLCEPLAFGLAPESTAAFFVQRQRWAQGAIQIMYLKEGPLGPKLRMRYRLLFLPSAWIFQGLASMYTLLAPMIFALFNLSPMVGVGLPAIAFYVLPMVVAILSGITLLAPGKYFPLPAQVLTMFQTFRILPVALQTLFRPKGLIFKVTPKGSGAGGGGSWEAGVLGAAMVMIALSVLAIGINLSPDYRIVSQDGLMPVVAFWLTFNMVMLFFVAMICLERPRIRGEERFPLKGKVTLIGEDGAMVTSDHGDISVSGLGLQVEGGALFKVGERVQAVIPGVGIVRGVVRRSGRVVGISFDFHSEQLRDRLIVSLFTDRMEVNRQRVSGLAASMAMLRRLWSADLRVTQGAVVAEEAPVVEEKLEAATRVIPPAAVGTPPHLRPAVAFSNATLDDEAVRENPVVMQAIEEAWRRANAA
jgi:cellulose synthase (UDP-forming)